MTARERIERLRREVGYSVVLADVEAALALIEAWQRTFQSMHDLSMSSATKEASANALALLDAEDK